MASKDERRWRDWRVGTATPLRQDRMCACGTDFVPVVRQQTTCPRCAQEAWLRERKIREALEPYEALAGELKRRLKLMRRSGKPHIEIHAIREALQRVRAEQERARDALETAHSDRSVTKP